MKIPEWSWFESEWKWGQKTKHKVSDCKNVSDCKFITLVNITILLSVHCWVGCDKFGWLHTRVTIYWRSQLYTGAAHYEIQLCTILVQAPFSNLILGALEWDIPALLPVCTITNLISAHNSDTYLTKLVFMCVIMSSNREVKWSRLTIIRLGLTIIWLYASDRI